MPRRPRLTARQVRLLGAGIVLEGGPPTPCLHSTSRSSRRRLGSAPSVSRILGLDLAIGTTGWCLLVDGRPCAHGSFELPKRRPDEPLTVWLARRAEELAHQVQLLVSTHRPELVGYEYPDVPRPHWSGGSKGRELAAVQGLARAEGFLVALWPRIGAGTRLVAVPMTLAKRLATGREGATKDQVAYALRVHRGWDLTGWSPDEVDAAAIALAAREVSP